MKKSEWVVRETVLSDVKELSLLMQEYIVDFYQRPKPSADKLDQLIHLLLNRKVGVQFVAEQQGKLLGFATLYFSYSTTKADKITVMNDLYVIEDFRGKGVANELFKACHEFTRTNHYAHMGWVTAEDNERAKQFYKKAGGTAGNWISYSIV
jgi:GNAT superfamily N-acetyltransferase